MTTQIILNTDQSELISHFDLITFMSEKADSAKYVEPKHVIILSAVSVKIWYLSFVYFQIFVWDCKIIIRAENN